MALVLLSAYWLLSRWIHLQNSGLGGREEGGQVMQSGGGGWGGEGDQTRKCSRQGTLQEKVFMSFWTYQTGTRLVLLILLEAAVAVGDLVPCNTCSFLLCACTLVGDCLSPHPLHGRWCAKGCPSPCLVMGQHSPPPGPWSGKG